MLAQFERLVSEGKIRYFLARGTGADGSSASSAISTWVASAFSSQTVGGVTVYDLTASR